MGSDNSVGFVCIGTIRKRELPPSYPSPGVASGSPSDAGVPRRKRMRLAEESVERTRASSFPVKPSHTDRQYEFVAGDLALALVSGRDPLAFGVQPGMDRDQLYAQAIEAVPSIVEWSGRPKKCRLTADGLGIQIIYTDSVVSDFFFSRLLNSKTNGELVGHSLFMV